MLLHVSLLREPGRGPENESKTRKEKKKSKRLSIELVWWSTAVACRGVPMLSAH